MDPLTPAQTQAFKNARTTALGFIDHLRQAGIAVPIEARDVFISLFISSQMGMAINVAQFDANTRAEIARLTPDQVVEGIGL